MTTHRVWITTTAGLIGLVLAVAAGLTVGPAHIPLGHTFNILVDAVGLPVATRDWPAWQNTVILDVRLPRVLVGLFVGAGLSLSGAAMQAMFRNPLAEPGVIGVSAGAALGAVLAIHLGLASLWVWALPGMALIGAGVTAFVVYAIATQQGRTATNTLLLAGVAIGSLNGAMVSLVLSLSLAEWQTARDMVYWLLGGLDARTWDHVLIVAPVTLIGSGALLLFTRDLDALLLGQTHARSIGVDVPRLRLWLILISSALTGAAVAVSGVIGFVGLIVPHVVRHLVGPSHARLMPATLLFGGTFLVATDGLARWIAAPQEVRLGVITAGLGAPFFLFLLMRANRDAPQP